MVAGMVAEQVTRLEQVFAEGPDYRVWWDARQGLGKVSQSGVLEVTRAKAIMAGLEAMSTVHPGAATIFYVRGVFLITKQARRVLASMGQLQIRQAAFVHESLRFKFVVNAIVRASGTSVPVRHFVADDEALQWLGVKGGQYSSPVTTT